MQNQESGSPRPPLHERVNSNMNIFLFICSILAFPSVVFLHRRLGPRYVGLQAVLAIPLFLLWASAWPNTDPGPVVLSLGLYLFMCFVARMSVLRRTVVGEDGGHRYYDGTPRLLRFAPRASEEGFKKLEPVIVFVVAVLAMPLSEAVGSFLMLSAIALMVTVTASDVAIKDRVDTMRDQEIEQRYIVEQYRRVRGK